ncbi:MAG: hypothetical protein WBF64_05210, partial [Xanthobacteraceae bacterium]
MLTVVNGRLAVQAKRRELGAELCRRSRLRNRPGHQPQLDLVGVRNFPHADDRFQTFKKLRMRGSDCR